MPDTIVDKVMAYWVYSCRLTTMTTAQVEEAIHSVGLAPLQGLEPLTIVEIVVEDKDWERPPTTLSLGRKRRGKRENLDPGVLFSARRVQEKAQLLGVSHMTVRRAIKELKGREENARQM